LLDQSGQHHPLILVTTGQFKQCAYCNALAKGLQKRLQTPFFLTSGRIDVKVPAIGSSGVRPK
jgi:hypothetical protein